MSAKIVIGLLFGALFIWMVAQGVSGQEEQQALWSALATAELLYVVPFAVLVVIYHLLRVVRWQLLLNPTHPRPFRSLFAMNMIGFLALNVLPARLGELVKPFLLLEREQVPLSVGFATVLIERMLDFLCMLLILALVAFWVDLPTQVLSVRGVDYNIREGVQRVFLLVALPAVGGLIGLLVVEEWMYKLMYALFGRLLPRLCARLEAFFRSFMSALRPLKQPRVLLVQVLLTLLIWSTAPAMEWLMFKVFHLDQLGLDAALTVVGAIMVGLIIPGPPGFAGTFEAFAMAGMTVFGVGGGLALAYALLLHWVQFVQICLMGLYYLWRDRISFASVIRISRELKEDLSTSKPAQS